MKRHLTSTPRLFPLSFTIVALASAAAVACTITSSTPTDTPTDPSTPTDGDGGASSSSSSSSGGPEGNGKFGMVSMTQTSFDVAGTSVESYSVIASFSEGTSTDTQGGSTTCKVATEGECVVTECDLDTGDAGTGGEVGDAGTPRTPHAGDIDIAAELDLTLNPDEEGSYAFKTGQVKLFGSEQDIQVAAKGADVPAFSTTLKAPTFVTLSEPTWPAAGQPLVVNRANALPFKWDAGTSGDVLVTLSTTSQTKMASVSCTFKASAGEGTVAAAALGKLLEGTGSVSVTASSTTLVDAGDWKVSVSAMSPAKAGSALASGQLQVE